MRRVRARSFVQKKWNKDQNFAAIAKGFFHFSIRLSYFYFIFLLIGCYVGNNALKHSFVGLFGLLLYVHSKQMRSCRDDQLLMH